MWNAPEARHPRYAAFKSALYSLIDPRFSAYFDASGEALIRRVEDGSGAIWTMDKHALTAADGRALRRIPAQRAFWFGWYAAFPSTRLVR